MSAVTNNIAACYGSRHIDCAEVCGTCFEDPGPKFGPSLFVFILPLSLIKSGSSFALLMLVWYDHTSVCL